MPELPEVQTIVNDLNKKVVGRRIMGVWFDWPKMLHANSARSAKASRNAKAPMRIKIIKGGPSAKFFEKSIKRKKILGVRRRAKNILFSLGGDLMMLIHLKMTGHLLIGKWQIVNGKKAVPIEPKEVVEDPYNQYIHLIFYLDDGRMIGFSDVRKFGKVVLGTKEQIENLPELKNLGPEPLDKNFNFGKFKEALRQAQGKKIKQALIDPEVIAGIGNIYSDDILWTAKIHPFKPGNKLSGKELKELWSATKKVLTKALRLRGTSYSDYRDTAGKEGYYADYRLVYQREGESCQRCKTKIKRVKIGGRSAHFCPTCQKL